MRTKYGGEILEKRDIDKKDLNFMEKELDYFESKSVISHQQKSTMVESYRLKEKHDFIKIVLAVGAILLGAGVLSFIAGNWMFISKFFKFFLIVFSVIGVNLAGYKLEETSPKTSRSLYYLGVLIYGAGIFLVGQTFNLGGEFPSAFLLWTIGIVGIGIYLKDSLVLGFSVVLLLIYSNVYYFETAESLPLIAIIITPLFYYLARYINYNKIFTFFINLLALNLITLILVNLLPSGNESLITLLVLFAIGLAMYYYKSKNNFSDIFNIQGGLVHWFTGFLLTFPGFWSNLSDTKANIFWGIAYFVFALFLMNKGSLLSIFIVCSIILRFYVDVSYDFLPQSLVFVIGGLILLGFGYYFERQRRKGEKF